MGVCFAASSLGDGAKRWVSVSVTGLTFDSSDKVCSIAGRLRLTAERHAGRSIRVNSDKFEFYLGKGKILTNTNILNTAAELNTLAVSN